MQFRLTYAGPLRATQRDARAGEPAKHAENRHQIRTVFHRQLKALWELPPLKEADEPVTMMALSGPQARPANTIGELAQKHAHYGFNFVPLVTEELDLLCGLEVLLLRPDRPGSVVLAGDIDNRLKTLLDALRIPEANEDYVKRVPGTDESPFFCLLEDDKLLTKVSVETDRLLEPLGEKPEASDVRIIITVNVRPFS